MVKKSGLGKGLDSLIPSAGAKKSNPAKPEVNKEVVVEKVVKKGVDNKIFAGCEVFDVYQGEHVQEGFKSVAFRIRMQDANTTMTDEMIETQMANVRAVLKKNMPELSFRG